FRHRAIAFHALRGGTESVDQKRHQTCPADPPGCLPTPGAAAIRTAIALVCPVRCMRHGGSRELDIRTKWCRTAATTSIGIGQMRPRLLKSPAIRAIESAVTAPASHTPTPMTDRDTGVATDAGNALVE